jgi:hypothetical protein
MTMMTIQCHCGAVKMEMTGEPFACLYCHCSDCQAMHGAAYLPAALFKTDQTRVIAGEPGLWKLKTTARATCRECGTRMYAEPPGLGFRSIPAHLLPEGVFKPAFHIQCQYAVLPIKDELPHYKGFPAAFGGSDEQMPW